VGQKTANGNYKNIGFQCRRKKEDTVESKSRFQKGGEIKVQTAKRESKATSKKERIGKLFTDRPNGSRPIKPTRPN